jgi:hypothetical protein
MAMFGRDFVRAATQPQFAQGLFTAAQQIGAAPRRRQIQEQLASASPLDRFNLAIDQLTRAGEYDKAADLTAKRDKYIADQQVRTDNLLVDFVSAQMSASGDVEVPTTVTYNGQTVSVPLRLQSSILEAVNEVQTARDARETAVTSGTLTSEYADYIEENPRLLEQNPMLAKTYENLLDPDSGMLRTTRINAVKSLIKMVDEDRVAQKEAKFGDESNKVRVQQLIDRIEARGSNTWLWQGNDMADALDDMSDAERKTFIEQAALQLKQNPNATDSEIIDYGMSGMKKMIPAQEQSEAISEAERVDAEFQELIITTLMEQENISREQAIKRLKADQRSAALFGAGEAIATQGMPITGGI